MHRVVAVAFWVASVSLVFVSLYPEKRTQGGKKVKERAVVVLSLATAVSFTVLVLLAFIAGRMGSLDRWWNPTIFKVFGAKRPIAFVACFVLSLLWWRGVILLQGRHHLFLVRAFITAAVFALFVVGLYLGLMLTEMLWSK